MNRQLLSRRQYFTHVPHTFWAPTEYSSCSSCMLDVPRQWKAAPVGRRQNSASCDYPPAPPIESAITDDKPIQRILLLLSAHFKCCFLLSNCAEMCLQTHPVPPFYLQSLTIQSVWADISVEPVNQTACGSEHSWFRRHFFVLPFLFENVNLTVDKTHFYLKRSVIRTFVCSIRCKCQIFLLPGLLRSGPMFLRDLFSNFQM